MRSAITALNSVEYHSSQISLPRSPSWHLSTLALPDNLVLRDLLERVRAESASWVESRVESHVFAGHGQEGEEFVISE